MYADSKYWVEAGLIDYIVPQIYWEIGHETADFAELLDWWAKVISFSGTDTKLYIGLADYKTLEKAGGTSRDNGAEINRQIMLCNDRPEVSGTVHFRYGSIAESLHLQQVLQKSYTENVLP